MTKFSYLAKELDMKKLKQTDIAKSVKISDGFLSEILAGKKSPYWQTAKKLFSVTGVAVDIWMEAKLEPERLQKAMEVIKKNGRQSHDFRN